MTVEHVLKTDPRTRNCDQLLELLVWWELYPEAFKKVDGEWVMKVEAYKSFAGKSDIKRIRASIQNDLGMYLPTDPDVIKKRNHKQTNWEEKVLYA